MLFAPPGAGPMLVEPVAVNGLSTYVDVWRELTDRQLEPNAFLEPDFCVPALQQGLAADRVVVVLVWAVNADRSRQLVGLAPLIRPRFPLRPFLASWSHDLTAQGGLVLDRDHAVPAVRSLLAWMAWRHPGAVAWLVPSLPAKGATARAIAHAQDDRPSHCVSLEPRARAVLGKHAPAGLDAVSRKKAKELVRQRRRLAERGALRETTARASAELAEATELFLALEAKGWKGRRGTALRTVPAQADFIRAMTQRMGARGHCRIDALMLGDAPLAMGIVLSSGDRDYFWKTAYDEAHAGASPGVQLTLGLTERQRGADRVELTDSCAQPDHPMIDHLWRERIDIAELLVAMPGHPRRRFVALASWERGRRGARALAKRLIAAAREIKRRFASR